MRTRKQDAEAERLEAAYLAAGRALRVLSGGGAMGLTPERVRNTLEWKQAKRAYDAAFAAYRAYNAARNTR